VLFIEAPAFSRHLPSYLADEGDLADLTPIQKCPQGSHRRRTTSTGGATVAGREKEEMIRSAWAAI
jgi:hypothetical protein